MRKRKWFIPAIAVSVLLIGGITGGLVAAASNSSSASDDQGQPSSRYQALLDRACAIYEENTGVAVDSGQLQKALDQAQGELREDALENWLQKLVDDGEITQEEADQYLEWWQSRPDLGLPSPGLGGDGHRGGMMRGGCFGFGPGPRCAPGASAEAGN